MGPSVRRKQVAERLDRLRELGQRRGGVPVLASRANVAWATVGGQHHVVTASASGVGRLVVGPAATAFVAPSIEAGRLDAEEFAGLDLDIVAAPWWEPTAMDRAIAELVAGHPVLDDAAIEEDLRPERSVLSAADIDRLAVLGRMAEAAVVNSLAAVVPGTTEDELAASLVGRIVGARAPVVLVAADERIALFRHPLPTAKPVRRRVMLVLVAEAWGLHVAVTRIRELVEPDPEIAQRLRLVEDVHRAMIEATTVGATLGDVLAVAQSAYAAAGRPDEWRDHHQGGSIAYNGREVVATPGEPTEIRPGMAFAWNPSIAGAKAEDTFVLASDGTRRFVTGRDPAAQARARPNPAVSP